MSRVGVRGQGSVRRSQELEFRIGVGEWKVVFLFKVFNAEAQRRVTAAQAGLAIRSEPDITVAESDCSAKAVIIIVMASFIYLSCCVIFYQTKMILK